MAYGKMDKQTMAAAGLGNGGQVAGEPQADGEEQTADTFLQMVRERWSVRRFSAEQISDKHMARILEAGRNAPSACNYQPQRILVLQSDEAIARMRAVTGWAFNAPTILLACADLEESWKNPDGADSAEVDTAIALDHMMMEAWECGVGSTWVRGFDERIMREAFSIPPTWKIVAMMPMGYPAENAQPSRWHFRRKQSEELYQFI